EQGVFRKKAAEALAGFSLARASMEQLEKWLQQAVETFGSNLKITQDLTVNMSNVFEQTTDAGRFVLGHTRA
ncbi:type III secretion system translocon subunit SctE, partial [Chromobacterium piscinae]